MVPEAEFKSGLAAVSERSWIDHASKERNRRKAYGFYICSDNVSAVDMYALLLLF